jgi:hypothetical protein
MAEPNLQARLSKLREQHQTRLQDIDHEYERSRAREAEIQDTIEQLRADLEGLRQTCQELEAEKDQQIQLHHDQEADLVLKGLEASYDMLLATQAYWLAKVRLTRQREALLEQDPDLGEILRDYQTFEQSPSDALESVPSSYWSILVEEHKKRASRVGPYLDLLEEERSLTCPEPLVLRVVMSYERDSDLIRWVFPFRADDQLSSEAYDALCEVVWRLQHKVINLGLEPDWFLDDASMDTWCDFDALLVEGDYAGDGSPTESAQRFLAEATALRLFEGADVTVRLVEMSGQAWRAGIRKAEPQVVTPEEEHPTVPEEAPELEELTDGWYTEDDIVSWDRPLRVVSDSLWNVQARRLRTLLIRMIGKGKVGTESVAIERLWQHVPSPHKQNLKTGVGRLVEEELIVHTDSSSENGHNVSLNPERLEDVQDLINRDITQLWAGIISSAARAE